MVEHSPVSEQALLRAEEARADRDVVARVLGGDAESYADLIRRHQGRVRGLCLSLLGDPAAADDAAQDVFLKAYRSLSDFRSDAAFSTWIYRIASNHCLDVLRSRARRRSDSLEALLEQEGSRVRALLAGPGPAGALEDRDLAARMLASLPEEQRLALTLREMQGLSYVEIAKAMDCSVDSVKGRLKRARHDLQSRLRHFLGGAGV